MNEHDNYFEKNPDLNNPRNLNVYNQSSGGIQTDDWYRTQNVAYYVNSNQYMQPCYPRYYPQPPKNNNTGLIISIVIASIVLIIGIASFVIVYNNNQERIVADRERAQDVTNLIAMIGEISLGSGDDITDARSAYDALTENQQKYVSNLADLTTAEKNFEKMEEEEEARLEAERETEAAKEAAVAAAKAAAKEAAKNNWKAKFEQELWDAYGEVPAYYCDHGDGIYAVYVRCDGELMYFVTVDSKTGYWHG